MVYLREIRLSGLISKVHISDNYGFFGLSAALENKLFYSGRDKQFCGKMGKISKLRKAVRYASLAFTLNSLRKKYMDLNVEVEEEPVEEDEETDEEE